MLDAVRTYWAYDSGYDIPCLILYIKCSISYKYFKLCSNIWIRVEILLYICVWINFSGNGEVVQREVIILLKEEVMKIVYGKRSAD